MICAGHCVTEMLPHRYDLVMTPSDCQPYSSRETVNERKGDAMERIRYFLYGCVCYLVFFGTFLYAIGFIGNLVVPRTLDGVASTSAGMAVAIDVALLLLFALQHSIMARRWFKERWTRIIPQPIERSTYVLFSSLALILLFSQWEPIGGIIWSVEDPIG